MAKEEATQEMDATEHEVREGYVEETEEVTPEQETAEEELSLSPTTTSTPESLRLLACA